MDRLARTPELLDGPLDPKALAGNLRDLGRVNRWLGGVQLSRRALVRLQGRGVEPLTVLDVGTGGADIPLRLLATWSDGARPRFTAVDSRPEVLEAARRLNRQLDETDGLTLELADGLSMPWSDASFDVAHSSLVLHHLDPDEAVAILREMGRVARIGVIVNDLQRARIHWLGAWLLSHLLTRNTYTRNDAPLSVRRAYTTHEMSRLLVEAGLQPRSIDRGFMGHRWAIVAVPVAAHTEADRVAAGAADVGSRATDGPT